VTEPTPPSWELILDCAEGRATSEQQEQLELSLMQGDPRTRELLDWVRGFHAQARAAALATPPPLVAQRLRRIPALVRGRAAPVQQLRAAPVLDTRLVDRITGVRAPAQDRGDRFQITYRAQDIDVVLDVAPERPESDRSGTVTLRGQVLPERATLPVFEAAVHGPFGSITSITGDELGGFELRGVPLQTERLTLTNDLVLIDISARSWWQRQ
jgi:hypothetical protein